MKKNHRKEINPDLEANQGEERSKSFKNKLIINNLNKNFLIFEFIIF